MVVIAISCTPKQNKQEINTTLDEEMNQTYAYGICVDSLVLNHFKIEKGDYLSSILMNLGFTGNNVEQIAETISSLYHPSKLHALPKGYKRGAL